MTNGELNLITRVANPFESVRNSAFRVMSELENKKGTDMLEAKRGTD